MGRRFPYVKLHDQFPHHQKIGALSDAAFRAQVTAICYSHALSTDGFYPAAEVRRHPRRAVDELVRTGVWTPTDGGYSIHDYGEWNETKAEIEARANAKSIAGAMGAATRWGDGTTHVAGVNAIATASGSADLEVQKPQPRDKVYTAEFHAFWAAYPRHEAKRAAFKAWEQAIKRADASLIVIGAEGFANDPNRTEEFTPHPATWLNRDCWEDDPQPERGSNGYVSPVDRLARRAMEVIRDRP
jgi:hypothetical protein